MTPEWTVSNTRYCAESVEQAERQVATNHDASGWGELTPRFERIPLERLFTVAVRCKSGPPAQAGQIPGQLDRLLLPLG